MRCQSRLDGYRLHALAANRAVRIVGMATGSVRVNSIEWLQTWYRAQCNGEWEHQYGVQVETLDNPGWKVKIDLTGTSLQNLPMGDAACGAINHVGLDGDQDWLQCKVENNRFDGAGGPSSLLRICDVFMDWVESKNT